MPVKKSLNSEKLRVKKMIENNNKLFFNNASLNNLTNKVIKSKSFKKVDEVEKLLKYIKENSIIYKAKDYKDISTDVTLDEKLKNDKKTKIIKVSYDDYIKNKTDYYEKLIVDKVLKLQNKNIVEIAIKFPGLDLINKDIFNKKEIIENNKSKSKLNLTVYWFLHIASGLSKFEAYWEEIYKDNGKLYNKNYLKDRLNKVKISINSYPIIKSYNMSDHMRVMQRFKDNGLNLLCVPTAIEQFCINKIQSLNTGNSMKKYKAIINEIRKPEYNKPYTIEDLESLGKKIKVSFTITDFINEDIFINQTSSNSCNIKLLNNKYGHLELINNNIINISEDRAEDILKNLTSYVKVGASIYSKNATYNILPSIFSEELANIKEDFFKSNYIKSDSTESEYINNYYMNMHNIVNGDLFNEYIKNVKPLTKMNENIETFEKINDDLDAGLNIEAYRRPLGDYNSDIKNDDLIKQYENENFEEIDLIKAYFNLTNNSPYGVPSNSFIYYDSEYARDIEAHLKNEFVGFYTVNITSSNDIIKYLFKSSVNVVLTTPQICTLKKHNINFIVNSCILAPSIKLKFKESTKEEHNGVPIYSKIVGIMNKKEITSNTVIKCDMPEKFIKLINNKEDNKEIYIDDYQNINILTHKNKTLKHMGYFIHSHTTAEIMDFILTNGINNILGVKLDSIIVKKNSFLKYDNDKFKIKKPKIYRCFDFNKDFVHPIILHNDYINNCKPAYFENNEINNNAVCLLGKGGSGKSNDIKTNFDRDTVVYVSYAWARGVDFKENYACTISSLNRIEGNKCEKLKTNDFFRIEVYDEATLINNSFIKNRIQACRQMGKRIFIIGDIDKDGFNFQCSLNDDLVKGFKMCDPSTHTAQLIQYSNNYRFDNELNNKLDKLREFMKNNKDNSNKLNLLNKYILTNFKECIKNKEDITYNKNDLGISALQEDKLNFKYTKYYLNDSNKKFIINKTQYNKNIIKSQSTTEEPTNTKNYDIRLFQTIHSVQGMTCPLDSKLIIIMERNFDYQLFYTALSRARNMQQINIIIDF